jgi:hypothetical protein
MSSQSAQHRTASQATVNNYRPTIAPKPSQSERPSPKWAALALMLPASVVGWFAVPALVEFATRLFL